MMTALDLARTAQDNGEVPVGALIVDPSSDEIVSTGYNRPIQTSDPTGHAELLAIRAAAEKVQNYRLIDLELFVTLEPCTMCAGAISFARLSRLVFGADDKKGGAVTNGVRFFDQPTCHWTPDVLGGVHAQACGDILVDFFKARRKSK